MNTIFIAKFLQRSCLPNMKAEFCTFSKGELGRIAPRIITSSGNVVPRRKEAQNTHEWICAVCAFLWLNLLLSKAPYSGILASLLLKA